MSTIIIISKRQRKAIENAKKDGYLVIDVTSNSSDPTFVKFSPFYPHGGIPVPGESTMVSESVEGIWQGLKVFENGSGIDAQKFKIKNMKGIKRGGKGVVKGHLFAGKELLDYVSARKMIYLPSYAYILKNNLHNELTLLKGLMQEGNKIALLDYTINENINDTTRPLSHASIIKDTLNTK